MDVSCLNATFSHLPSVSNRNPSDVSCDRRWRSLYRSGLAVLLIAICGPIVSAGSAHSDMFGLATSPGSIAVDEQDDFELKRVESVAAPALFLPPIRPLTPTTLTSPIDVANGVSPILPSRRRDSYQAFGPHSAPVSGRPTLYALGILLRL